MMAAFEDKTGQRWGFAIDFPSLRRVNRRLGVDMLAMSTAELFERLASPLFLFDLLYCLCEPEVIRAGLTDEEFGRRCVVPVEPIVAQIVEEMADFFLELGKPQQAETLTRVWAITTLTSGRLSLAAIGDACEQMEQLILSKAAENGSGEKSIEPQQMQAG